MLTTKVLKIDYLQFLTTLLVILFCSIFCNAQIFDNFSDGDFTANPEWFGETDKFQITNSSAIPPELKPALQLFGLETDTTILYLPNTLLENTEWQFWVKLSFNTSANNFARIYLVSDQENLNNDLNGYFVQIGGSNDSIGLFRQEGQNIVQIIQSTLAFTGNSTNILRVKVTRDDLGNWELFSASDGSYNFQPEGICFDNSIIETSYFGIFCRYTSSNATKFYFDDFYVSEIGNDTIPPEVESIEVLSNHSLIVNFTEAVDAISSEEISNYFVDNEVGNPVSAIRDPENKVTLEFSEPFQNNYIYQITVSNITDLAGNILIEEAQEFLYQPPVSINPFEILINEIMADENPLPVNLPEADYLELYNTTDNPVNLSNFTIQPRESAEPVSFPAVIISPDSFLIVVNNSDTTDFIQFGQVVGLPGFSLNNEGSVVLRNPQGNLIHAISYTTDWYKDEEKQDGGWSMEQIDPGHPCSGDPNWMATFNENGGTPGFRNSVDAIKVSTPQILDIEVINSNILIITFSEVMDSISITTPEMYFVDGFDTPESIITDEIIFNKVWLSFSENFTEQIVYTLNLTDTLWNCSNNFIAPGDDYPFVQASDAEPFEIVINEIMYDPEPPVALPAFEYIEIFNTSDKYLKIHDWTLKVGTVSKDIEDFIIEPNEHVIFTVNDGKLIFSLFGKTIGFTSLGLSNSGTSINLLDQNDILVSYVNYRDDWIKDENKNEGGWSLEQIDPFYPCTGEGNWTVCINSDGGSPGVINSVDAENIISPEIQSVFAISDTSLEVKFNQSMSVESLLDISLYQINRNIGEPSQILVLDSMYQSVILYFPSLLHIKTLYTLTVDQSIMNCTGTSQPADLTFEFGLHEAISKNDIVINEVLFNPVGNGVDFVEIYNRSEKIINVRDLKLGEVDIDDFGIYDTTLKSITSENTLLLMNEYLALTSDPDKVMDQYFTENPDGFIKVSSFPTYSNEEGKVVLTNESNTIVDVMEYYESMHHPLLVSVEGVSIERIAPNRASGDETNWHSASKDVGFATPAYQNSQYSESIEPEDEVMVEPEIFSPDNDGYNDILNIHYNFGSPGYTANIIIFDERGRQVKILVQNSLLGSSGTFSWDGRTDDNQKANIGIYLIYFEAFDTKGNVKKIKKTAVLAGRIGN